MNHKRNILLCVAGMSPQIITETLFALTQNENIEERVKIHEIRVITTLDGKNKVINTLLNKETGIFYEFCRDFGIDANSIKFDETCISLFHKRDGEMLEDIRTEEDNEIAGDKICEIVRELCKAENTKIYASAAGGRKTMSIYLALAMSLFGRAEDELSHVLVSEGFESNTFFYPPPTPMEIDYFNPQTKITKKVNTADARIYLAPIPFIRFRGINVNLLDSSRNSETYKQAVDKAQIALKEKESANYEFRINLKKEIVSVVEKNSNLSAQVKLTLREIFVVALFANFRLNNVGQNGFVGWKEITDKHLLQTCEQICLARGQKPGNTDFSFLPKSDFIGKLHFETAKRLFFQKKCERFEKAKGRRPEKGEIGLTKREIKTILEVWVQILGKMNKKFDAVFPQSKAFQQFYIQRDGEKESHTYGYIIAPENIKFDE